MNGKRVRLYTKDYGGTEAILATTGRVISNNEIGLTLEEDKHVSNADQTYFVPWTSVDWLVILEEEEDVPF